MVAYCFLQVLALLYHNYLFTMKPLPEKHSLQHIQVIKYATYSIPNYGSVDFFYLKYDHSSFLTANMTTCLIKKMCKISYFFVVACFTNKSLQE
jgi:hypothetical protein